MAYTSVIPVRRLDRTVDYVQNKAKTTPKSLEEAVDYAANRDKTESACFETGLGCTTTSAFEDMRLNTLRWHKETGVQGYHLVQSFAEGEVTPELAHQIGVEFAEQLLHGKYQAIVTTHLNTKHYHNHIVWSAVSLEDGKKYHSNSKSYYTEVRALSDSLCQKYGLSIIETPESLRGKRQYEKWRAEENNKSTWRTAIRQDVDEAIQQSLTWRQFLSAMERKGYEVRMGRKYPVLRPPGKERFVRLARNFGAAYTEDGIRRRILSQPLPQAPHPEAPKERKKVYSMDKWQKARQITGFRALYLYYCYKLGVFPKRRPQNRARLHFLLREDLIKLNNISQEVRLLARHHIDTAEQLALYKKEQEVQITTLSAQRRALQKALRTKPVRDSPEQADAHRAQIRELSERLKALRREVHLCDDIAERSGVMAEKLKAVREDEKNQQKEEQQHEHIR